MTKERALELLFREKSFEDVRQWLGRLQVPDRDLEDVVQEVFLNVWESFHTYDPTRARPERWLNRITVHVAAHYLERAYHKREKVTTRVFISTSSEDSADELLWRLRLCHNMKYFLRSIEAELRLVLLAHDLEGVPMEELAERTGVPLSTLYKWRVRGCKVLRKKLVDNE